MVNLDALRLAVPDMTEVYFKFGYDPKSKNPCFSVYETQSKQFLVKLVITPDQWPELRSWCEDVFVNLA